MVPLAAAEVMSLESRRHAENPNRSARADRAVSALVIAADIDQPLPMGAVCFGHLGQRMLGPMLGLDENSRRTPGIRRGGDESGRQVDMNESPERLRSLYLPMRRGLRGRAAKRGAP